MSIEPQRAKKVKLWHILAVVLLLLAAAGGGTFALRFHIEGLERSPLTGRLYYCHHGFPDRSYSGLAENAEGTWYVQEGRVDMDKSGLLKLPEGWYLLQEGRVADEFDGFVRDGLFCWYLTGGKVRFHASGLYYGRVDDEPGWWYVKNGRVIVTDDVVKSHKAWWRVKDGKVRFSYDGIAENEHGKWFLSDGRVDFSANGLVTLTDGTYFIEKGRVMGEIHADSTMFIAHRGLSAVAPENTMRAFTEAGKAGFWGCETDVWQTADQRFVLMHDDTFERMCGDSRRAADLSAEEIGQLRIINGKHFEDYQTDAYAVRVPFLEEYLKVCRRYNMVPVIEIKETAKPENADDADRIGRLLSETLDIMGERQVIFISFDLESLKILRGLLDDRSEADVSLQLLTMDADAVPMEECKSMQIGVDAKYDAVKETAVASLHAQNLPVNVWTVNHEEDVFELLQMGVDYITTNKSFWLDM